MRKIPMLILGGTVATGLAGSVFFPGAAMAAGAPHSAAPVAAARPAGASAAANGDLATTEYYYFKPKPMEVITISAIHWGSQSSVAYTLINFRTKAEVSSGTISLKAGVGSAQIDGLGSGTYEVLFSHIDTTSGDVIFGVNCDKTC